MAALDTLLARSAEPDDGGNKHAAAVRRNEGVQPGECGRMPDGSQLGRSAPTTLLTLPNVITFAPAVRRAAGGLAGAWSIGSAWHSSCSSRPGLSDAVDGWLARRNGGGNSVGALLDPVADKALLVTMYVTLAAVRVLPDWLAILVVFRDMVIVGGIVVLSLLGQSGADPAAVRLEA